MGFLILSAPATNSVSIFDCKFENTTMYQSSAISFLAVTEEFIFEGNVFRNNQVDPAANFLNLKNIKKIIWKNNNFSNITYRTQGESNNLIMIPKGHLQSLDIDEILYEDSEINFMYLQGLNPSNETESKLDLKNIVVRNITFERSGQIF